jgi:ribosomal protein S18 acetylase RimI-like enzyme
LLKTRQTFSQALNTTSSNGILMPDLTLQDITENNITEYPPVCFLNPKNEGYQIKREWLQNRFAEGLKIKLLSVATEKKPVGFIEYVPGEYAWRAVDATGYLFIHCIWVSPNKYKEQGYGSLLVQECIKDAAKEDKYGVAVVTSDGPFMAGTGLFIKNVFTSVARAKPSFDLMVKPLKEGAPLPQFRDCEKQLGSYKGLHVIYANQCPWVARSINDLREIAAKTGWELHVTELKTAHEAQNAPSVYAVFNLVYNGKLLVDHYISNTRFQNIIKKELHKNP